MTEIINNGNSYIVDKVIQNGVEYSLSNSGYVIGGDMSGITITSSISFTGGDDSDRGTFFNAGVISIINGGTLFGVIPGVYRNRRSQSNDLFNSVLLSVKKEPGQDFIFTMISGTSANDVWRGGNARVLSDGNTIKILTSYFERTWTNNTDTADYDIYDIDPAAMTATKNGTGSINTPSTFSSCDASTFGYVGFTDFNGTVPGYTNGRFTNLQFNDKYYPTFKLA